jgi:hypothetical protein
MKPSVGRIVHYVRYSLGDHIAAIITRVRQRGDVDLTLFEVVGEVSGAEGVFQDEDLKRPGTWHWPERED